MKRKPWKQRRAASRPAEASQDDPRTAVAVAEPPPEPEQQQEVCDRLVNHDSLRWTCACGGSGPVARSLDGMPFVNEEMLRHEPGQTKE